MVRLSQFDEHVQDIKKSFCRITKHSYMESYITDPEIDEDKVRFLFATLEQNLPIDQVKLFAISSLLVQAALDVHEGITLHKVTTDRVRKNRQLTILAGDYYSSLYYYLLATNNHLPL